MVRVLPNERDACPVSPAAPLPDSKVELPPVIRRAEVVAFALVALLIICVVAVLYVAKAFFLPVVTAFVVGTMLSPARRLSRAASHSRCGGGGSDRERGRRRRRRSSSA